MSRAGSAPGPARKFQPEKGANTEGGRDVAAASPDRSVLFIGGTGTISAACVRQAVAAGMSVYVLNRGRNVKHRALPDSVTWLQADVSDADSARKALGDLEFGAVANFLSY